MTPRKPNGGIIFPATPIRLYSPPVMFVTPEYAPRYVGSNVDVFFVGFIAFKCGYCENETAY